MRAGWVARITREPANVRQLPPILPRAPPGRAVAAAVSGELRGGRGTVQCYKQALREVKPYKIPLQSRPLFFF